MQQSPFSINILEVFGNFILNNFSWDKISEDVIKDPHLDQSETLWEVKKLTINQIFLAKLWYIGQIYAIPKYI